MKTISADPGMMMRFNEASTASGGMGKSAVPSWLPVPATRPHSVAEATAKKANKPSQSLWIPLEKDSFSQKLVGGLLVVVALASIVYGFSSLIDLVQNWAVVQSSIGQIL